MFSFGGGGSFNFTRTSLPGAFVPWEGPDKESAGLVQLVFMGDAGYEMIMYLRA